MYILDEIDAALDLSHTRFKGSQFIVVSLKEGLFTNANCYSEHGSGITSIVERTAQRSGSSMYAGDKEIADADAEQELSKKRVEMR